MNKIKALVFASCVISLNAFAQVPTESFKPVNQSGQTQGQVPGTSQNSVVNNAQPVQTTQPNTAPNPSVAPNPSITPNPSAVPVVPVNPSNNQVKPGVSVSNGMTDIQILSTQSTEEYMKRRNSTFESELTKCINEIPKNSKGQRSSESMLKCANMSKNHNPTVSITNNNNAKPSYLSDVTPNSPVQSNTPANPTTVNSNAKTTK